MTEMFYRAARRHFLPAFPDMDRGVLDGQLTDESQGRALPEGYRLGVRTNGGFSLNLATGQDAAGVIQTAGDLADANWKVSNANNYKQAPIAFTVAPGDADFYSQWAANGPSSSWIAADPDNKSNGNVTYTFTFSLSGYNPADAILQGGQFKLDDAGTVYLNGHALGSQGFNGWTVYTALSNGAGDFLAGVNTIVIQTTNADNQFEAARLEGTIVDTVLSNPPGPIHWASDVSGAFTTASDWVGDAVPEDDNDAVLDAAGKKAYTVISAVDETVDSIQIASTATLSITGGVFTALTGTGSGVDAGSIVVGDGATLSVSGTVSNSGIIGLGSAGSGAATLLVVAGNTTLSGGGEFTLSDFRGNSIVATATAATLFNVDNTIAGAGFIGSSTLTLVNDAGGVIDATGASALVMSTGSNRITNDGLIEATGAGGLYIRDATVDDTSGGILLAGDGARVHLIDVTLVGGALESEGSGVFHIRGSDNVFDGSSSTVTNAGLIRIGGGSTLSLEGAVDNVGRIELRSHGDPTALEIGKAGARLSGGGALLLGLKGVNNVVAASPGTTLTNIDNTIVGAGALGAGSLTLVNEAGGAIDGDSTLGLLIDTGTATVDNAGLIEASDGGSLSVLGAVENSGTLLVDGGTLALDGAVTGSGATEIKAGTLEAAAAFDQNVGFSGASGTLELAQSQSYGGTVSGFSRDASTSLDLRDIAFVGAGEGVYDGGVLTVTDGVHTASIRLAGDYSNTTFTASSDGHGGTTVVATRGLCPQSAAAFVATAAAMGSGGVTVGAHLLQGLRETPPTLAIP